MIEDFTTYTEVDNGADISKTASKITATAARSRQDQFYVYKDMGAGFFDGDFTHQFEIEFSSVGGNSVVAFWMLSNSVKDFYGVVNGSEDGIVFNLYDDNPGEDLSLKVVENGSATTDTWSNPGPQASTTYYITITRDDDGGVNNTGRITAEIRTGSHAGALQDTLTVDCSAGEQNDG